MNPICTKDRTEMRCVKTGKLAVFGESHVYRGDEFECPSCKSRVLVTAGQPTHEPDVLDSHRADELLMMGDQPTAAEDLVSIPRAIAERAAQNAAFFIAYSSNDETKQRVREEAAHDCAAINNALGTPL